MREKRATMKVRTGTFSRPSSPRYTQVSTKPERMKSRVVLE